MADQSAPKKTEHQDMDWAGLSPKSFSPGYDFGKSLGQPRGDTVSVEDVKRGYKNGG